MLLKLQRNLSAENTINKEIEDIESFEVKLKKDFDIYNPVIRIKTDSDLSAINYCRFEEMGRSYFIRDVSTVAYQVVSMTLEVDVLETFKADILASNARVMRGIKNGDYFEGALDREVFQTIESHESNKGFEGDSQLIMTTIRGA